MTESATDPFENDLRSLKPAEPSLDLTRAIGRALDGAPASLGRPPRRPSRSWLSRGLPWSIAVAAGCIAVAATLRPSAATRSSKPPASDPAATAAGPLELQPVGSAGMLLDARDEGIVYLDDGQPARKLRLQFVDTLRLQARDQSASLAVSYPREEIRLIPISTY